MVKLQDILNPQKESDKEIPSPLVSLFWLKIICLEAWHSCNLNSLPWHLMRNARSLSLAWHLQMIAFYSAMAPSLPSRKLQSSLLTIKQSLGNSSTKEKAPILPLPSLTLPE
ncbi:hypothetical protein LIER_43213 [Lithospermum erythrorhizon]|uniref:Uncharacterized protein n=1 Tax=Lithospermum erythrorhizon TaxID=34254 RepID=A0AAV3PS81_LITER